MQKSNVRVVRLWRGWALFYSWHRDDGHTPRRRWMGAAAPLPWLHIRRPRLPTLRGITLAIDGLTLSITKLREPACYRPRISHDVRW
jgi:hypothetical protein